jgi:hypothetical protein
MRITIIKSFVLFAVLLSCKPLKEQQQSTQAFIKLYTNKQFGISFNYPSNATVTEKHQPIRPDLGINDSGYFITVTVPFLNQYGKWTWKGIEISISNRTCDWGSLKMQQKTINGITYSYLDPESGETSGMSSVNKERMYYYQSSGKCYFILERISGLGNNERPKNATVPPDENSFLNSELVALDQIVASLKIKQ